MSKNFGGILNPQEKIPDVHSKYTIIKDQIHPIDLNEDSWSMDYFVIFFHTGPRDPVATELLHLLDKQNNPGVSEFPCKIVAISMDSPQAIYDWVQEFPDFDVPMMSDKENAIGEQFGVMMDWSPGLDHPGPGYCANAAFIVDKFDKVRYHSVLDARCVHDLDELARVVNALKATDNGKLAMVDWKDDSYSVENSKEAISKWQREYDESYKARHTTMMGKMRGWWGGESSDQGEAYPKQAQVSMTDEALDNLTLENENQNWQYSFGRLCISEDATDTLLIDGEGVYYSEDEADSVAEEEYTEHGEQFTDEEYYEEAPAGGGARYRAGGSRDTTHYGVTAEDEEIGKRRARARMEKNNPSQYRNPHPARNPSQRNRTPARNPSKYRNQTPSRHPSQSGRHPSQKRRSPSPYRNHSQYRRTSPPARRSATPARRSASPFQERRSPTPGRKSPYPGSRSAPPARRSPTQYRRSPSPARVPSQYRRSPPPSRRTPTRSPVHYRNPSPARQPSQYRTPYATRTPSKYQGRKPKKMESSRSKRRW